MSPNYDLFKRSNGYYYVRARTADGRQVWRSTRSKTKPEALAHLRAMEDLRPAPKPARTTLAAFTEDVLAYVEATHAPKTLETYQLALRAFCAFTGALYADEVTGKHADRFKAHRLASVSATTVNIQLRTLRAAFGLGMRWGVVKSNPFAGITLAKVDERPPVFLSREQYAQLLEAAGDEWLRNIIVFAVSTGMRQGEILNLRWSEVDAKARTVHVTGTGEFRTKTRRSRTVPLNATAAALIARQAAVNGHERVFHRQGRVITKDNLTHRFKAAVRAAGLPDRLHFHSLRHTFASWLVQDGVSLYQVARLLGHTSVKTTEVYAHLQPEAMHDVVERLNCEGDLESRA